MATIHKLKKAGSTIYPATITDAVVHQDIGATLTEMINFYNVSQLYKTSGESGGNTYTLEGAINVLDDNLQENEKIVGVHLEFIDSEKNIVVGYIYQGGTFINSSSWKSTGDIYSISDVTGDIEEPSFNPYSDTLHNSAQTLSDTQKIQILNNIGIYGETIYDISSKNNGTVYSTLSNALNAIPESYRQPGMTVRYITPVLATYTVTITDDISEEPTGIELNTEPTIDDGIYTAEQLDSFDTLPNNVGDNVVYYYEIVSTETYTTWTITKTTNDTTKYIQARSITTNWSNNENSWQIIDDYLYNILQRLHILEEKVNALPENFDVFTYLDINVGDSKTRFINNENWAKVWQSMQKNKEIPIAIYVNYTSGSKVLFIATCIKQNFISLHAKAGSCELRVYENGSFTISGTSLW